MQRFWRKWAPYWHICTGILFAIFVAITWVNDVSSAVPQVKQNTLDIIDLKGNMAGMRQEVHDIHEYIFRKGR